MNDVYDLKKRFNHRWKTDPLFLKGFDYDHPKYANVPDECREVIVREKDRTVGLRETRMTYEEESY